MGLVELLLPSRCAVSGEDGAERCRACIDALPRLRPPLCARCGAPAEWPVARCRECRGRRLAFAFARAAVRYDGPTQSLVHVWKEQGLRRLAAPCAELVAETLERPAVEALVAVPPDADRTLRRGHHPAGGLASELGRQWNLPVLRSLERTRGAERQRSLALRERRRNVAGAFAARESARRVALVDDVYTTGATAAAAASALRRAGARHVGVVTFARTVRLS